ncbi:unnamed protein product [Sphenostylis stenocarpa]|uniref:Uncharacterized protein n=1 Tax=Sphenostylis stenocarpa TaxID=92480 RepID=A0AA86VP65_9FABA|nr:unnamed protein product [Sphenostylis stenocarpa]
MKRSNEACHSDQDAKATLQYNSLVEDYSDMQKEGVSKKMKLGAENQTLDILLEEARDEAKPGSSRKDIHGVPIEREMNYVDTEIIEKSGNLSMDGKKNIKKKVSWKEEVEVFYN